MRLVGGILAGCVLVPALMQGQTVPVYSYSVPAPSATTGYAPNGSLLSYTDSVNGSWSMQYDSLNRLHSASGTAGAYQSLVLGWDYDSFGDRTDQTTSGTPPTGGALSSWAHYNSSNQAITGNVTPAYDAAGNTNYDGVNYYKYDAEGRICAAQSALNSSVTQYFYDADGNRVAKASAGSFTCSLSTASPTATYVIGPSGEQMTEFDQTGAWKHTNIFAGGQLLATYDLAGLHFPLSDPLGTVRVQASGLGVAEESFSNLPFGDGMSATLLQNTSIQDATEHHFTGKERDGESGNDYMFARYYNSATGRFLSPDWSTKVQPVPYAKLDNPQSLNLYSYVWNNPLGKADADGHCIEDACIVEGVVALTAFAESPAGQQAEQEAEEAAERYGPEIEGGVSRAANWAGQQLAKAGNFLEEKAQEVTGLTKNTDRILQGQASGAQYRVPDLMVKVGDDVKAIGEVKDTAKLANTRQLTDLMGAAKDSGAKFSLYLGERTQMTKPLATQLYNSGASVYRYTGGKFVDITKTLKPTQ